MPLYYRHDFHSRLADLWALSLLFRKDSPQTNYPPDTVPRWFTSGLEHASKKSGISLTSPFQPKPKLQTLPPILRIQKTCPISSYSKASGVFSSICT